MRIKTKPLGHGPKWARRWANSLLGDLIRTHIATAAGGAKLNETAVGTGLVAGNGGAAATGETETVTGAVNGVPSTLNVMTDGEGWIEI